jgi:hypothetical protein
MQKLFPSVSEAAPAAAASPDTPAPAPAPQDGTDTSDTSDATVAAPVRPFDWPPPEEDLDDWHVFQFDDAANAAATAPPAATPAAAPSAAQAPLKPSQTPTLKIVSPYADKPQAKTSFETPATEPIATPSFATPATAPIASPSFGTPATEPLGTPAPSIDTFATPETAPMEAPLPFATGDTTRIAAPFTAPPQQVDASASLGLSGALSESTLPARRVQTVSPVPAAAVSAEQPLKSTTVEVIARSSGQTARAPRRSWSWVGRTVVIGLALLATGEAAYIATMFVRAPAAAPQTAALFVQSDPVGAEILIDGQVRGKTPLRLDLPAGQHLLELRKDRVSRKLPLVLAAGAQASQYIELRPSEPEPRPGPTAAPPSNATPPAAPSQSGAATTASLNALAAAAANAAAAAPRPVPTVGWLIVRAPVTLSILRNGEAIGNSDDGRISIGAGRHELELSNSTAGYREAMAIQIVAGRETVLQPELPQSTLDVESTPRARVAIDGRDVGETPLNQLALTIGPHEIVFHHPDFPDKTVSTFIRVGTPAHVSVDLSTP